MTPALKLQPTSVDEYLAGEFVSNVKHEYIAGNVYAMAGGRNSHNLIASNCQGELYGRLSGQPCRTYNSDTKIRIRLQTQTRFYYPDASVICDPNSPDDTFQDCPVLIAEVLSDATRRIDEGEKKDAYLTIPTLSVYMLIEQDFPAVVVFRRSDNGFERELYTELDAVIPLDEIQIELPLSEIYDGVEFEEHE
ncbi:MAG: hypothetical protein CMJ78_10845 [Planctomycetaceae bacterium]|nr:hypothetical protein [Planctomycetaceae bacterium]